MESWVDPGKILPHNAIDFGMVYAQPSLINFSLNSPPNLSLPLNMKHLTLALALALTSLTGLTGCRNIVGLHHPEPVAVFNRALPTDQIVASIKDGASAQGWEVTEEGPGYVLVTNLPDATSRHNAGAGKASRARYATVRVSYTLDEINFAYINSERMSYRYITEGKQTVHYRYNAVLNALVQAVEYQVTKRVESN